MSAPGEVRPPAPRHVTRERWLRPYGLALVASALVGGVAVSRVLARAGEPAFPLDDSFIHLQYAARLAAGKPFEYSPGGGYTSGATSFAWPLAFVPFFGLGLTGLDLVWVAWVFGLLLHAAVAYETWRLGRGLLGPSGALAAGAMCSAFGAFAWFAWSGMETLGLAWLLVRTARVAAEYGERPRLVERSGLVQLAVLGLATPLVRPEGALASALVLLTVARDAWHSRGRGGRASLRLAATALAACLGPLVVPMAHRLGTGHSASSTAMVKHLAFDPYLTPRDVLEATLANVRMIATDLLDGGPWTVEFVPERFAWLLAAGLVALPWLARRRGVAFRAWLVVAIALGTLGPASYATMLWNRVRYLWPFAPGWFLVASAGFVELGHRLGRRWPMAGILGNALGWGLVAMLGSKLDWATADLANSARAIARQQVTLGRWAAEHLPPEAMIGVNDTGAIAYVSGRRTFDVVGLTTEGEAPYWAWGPGARFEHWERRREAGLPLPTHLFVYRQWMAMPPVEGPFLTEATVVDQSILGGRTMTAMEADYRLLGSGELPFAWEGGEPLGSLDVGDVESEGAGGYFVGEAKSHWCVAKLGATHSGSELADGGRVNRLEDRFRVGARRPLTLVVRVGTGTELRVEADGADLGATRRLASGDGFEEHAVALPQGAEAVVVREARPRRFTSYHYWWFAR